MFGIDMDDVSKEYEENVRKSKFSKGYILGRDISTIILCLFAIFFFKKHEIIGILGLLLSLYVIPYDYIHYFKKRDGAGNSNDKDDNRY